MTWKHAVKTLFAAAGYHLERNSENPQHSWIGLKTLAVRSIVDVGANEGQFARSALKHFPGAHVYCFEPLPGPFRALQAWAAERPAAISVFNVALGEEESQAEMFVHADHTPSSSLLKSTELSTRLYPFTSRQTSVVVPIRRLDDVISAAPRRLEPDVLVKLDVQGFEGRVLRGARALMQQARACIVEISLDTLYDGQSTFKEIFLELDSLSYRYAGNLSQAYSSDSHVVYIDAVFMR
jgi:FkbM family methyltransferase